MKKQLTDEMFYEALFKEDELGSVIRVHLHIEFHINEIVDKLVPYPKDLKALELDYNGKLSLIFALGVKTEYRSILSTLGKMRNKFAHNIFYEIDKSEINNLYKSLSKSEKRILQISHRNTRNQHKNDEMIPWSELQPRDQFILIAVLIRNIVMEIRDEIKK